MVNIFRKLWSKKEIHETVNDGIKSGEIQSGTKLYRHHFDVVLTHSDFALIPEGNQVHIQVNALSSSGKAWETLGELDGGGFIVSAFGTYLNTFVFELKLFYKALETLLIDVSNLSDNSITALGLTTVGGGQTPSEFPLQDSVTPL